MKPAGDGKSNDSTSSASDTAAEKTGMQPVPNVVTAFPKIMEIIPYVVEPIPRAMPKSTFKFRDA